MAKCNSNGKYHSKLAERTYPFFFLLLFFRSVSFYFMARVLTKNRGHGRGLPRIHYYTAYTYLYVIFSLCVHDRVGTYNIYVYTYIRACVRVCKFLIIVHVCVRERARVCVYIMYILYMGAQCARTIYNIILSWCNDRGKEIIGYLTQGLSTGLEGIIISSCNVIPCTYYTRPLLYILHGIRLI